MKIGTLRRAGSWLFNIAWVLSVLWLAGLAWFAINLNDPSPDSDSTVDAIVVLTGGNQRIDGGLKLLVAGKAKAVFVSGVPPRVDVAQILRLVPSMPAWVRCCVALGHEAANTSGNATETAQWLAQNGYRSIRLVTANYHMRRSLIEFRRVLTPDIRIIADPVIPDFGTYAWRYRLHLIVVEYIKYILAVGRMLVSPGHAFGHGNPLSLTG